MSSRANLKFTAIAKILHPLQLQCLVSINLADARANTLDSSAIKENPFDTLVRTACTNILHTTFEQYRFIVQ